MFRAFLTLLGILFIIALAGAGGVLFIFHNYGRDLPEYQQLADYEPPVMTRVYAGDGRLLAEYARRPAAARFPAAPGPSAASRTGRPG